MCDSTFVCMHACMRSMYSYVYECRPVPLCKCMYPCAYVCMYVCMNIMYFGCVSLLGNQKGRQMTKACFIGMKQPLFIGKKRTCFIGMERACFIGMKRACLIELFDYVVSARSHVCS